jgi:outer membrane protein assembly factor BamB
VKRALTVVAALLVIAAVAFVAALVVERRNAGRDVRGSPTVEFTPSTARQSVRPPRKTRAVSRRPWPMFGRDLQRTHALASGPRPPFRRVWLAGGSSLIEFPPSIGYHRLFFETAHGGVVALSTRTGRRAWRFSAGRCAASTPALGPVQGGTVYATFLDRLPCRPREGADGEVVALAVGGGAVRWRRRIGPSETSPLLAGSRVVVGDWNGRVWALNARNGHVNWVFRAGGAVKGGVAAAGGRLFFGAYDGHVYALNQNTGRLVWRGDAQPRLGGSSTFYSTPAVGYGRVYIGSTDRKVYSYGATSGKLRWSRTTGGYVYGSPALWRQRVFVGSYDGHFYCLDAATGATVWTFDAGNRISGSANVVGSIVYFATLHGSTFGLSARTGRLVWRISHGDYSAPVSDGLRLYAVGSGSLSAFVER